MSAFITILISFVIVLPPKIVQKGTVSIAGVSTPIPKLGLEWNAKGGIMTRPTAFGYETEKSKWAEKPEQRQYFRLGHFGTI